MSEDRRQGNHQVWDRLQPVPPARGAGERVGEYLFGEVVGLEQPIGHQHLVVHQVLTLPRRHVAAGVRVEHLHKGGVRGDELHPDGRVSPRYGGPPRVVQGVEGLHHHLILRKAVGREVGVSPRA